MIWVQIDIKIPKENKWGIKGGRNGVESLFRKIASRGVDINNCMPYVIKENSNTQSFKRGISTRGKLNQEGRHRDVDSCK